MIVNQWHFHHTAHIHQIQSWVKQDQSVHQHMYNNYFFEDIQIMLENYHV